MDKQLEFLCKKLKAHSVSLVYANFADFPEGNPWQVVVRHIDDKQLFFSFGETAQEAIDYAMKKNERQQ